MTSTKLPNWMAVDWLTNRHILVAVIFAAGFGFAGPGLFGLGPPKWFAADDIELLGFPAPAVVTPVPAPVSPSHMSPPKSAHYGLSQQWQHRVNKRAVATHPAGIAHSCGAFGVVRRRPKAVIHRSCFTADSGRQR